MDFFVAVLMINLVEQSLIKIFNLHRKYSFQVH
jgi:hypothetical protein